MPAEAPGGRIREVVTPEGVALPFEIASPIDRASAFVLDAFLIHVVVLVLFLAALFAGTAGGGVVAFPVALLGSFFLRNFYFTYCEIRMGGTTIGKRKVGLRVISRDGGPVTAEAVFARNLTRDVEVFLPATALMAPELVLPGLPGWARAIGIVWILIFALLPLFGREHLRIGDILAGTLVVRMPKAKLLPDLAARKTRLTDSQAGYAFTDQQLDLYGIKELQVLEEVLRKHQRSRKHEVVGAVAERIRNKISWPEGEAVDDWRFLNAFYKAQRARLEHKMLFGKKQLEKRE